MIIMGCQMLNEQIAQGSIEGYLDTYTVLPSLTSVCDSGVSGCDGALEMAAEMGKKVTIVEMLPEVARDAMFINKFSLMNGLAKNQVRILTDTKVVSIQEDGVTVEKQDGTQEVLKADTVISAFGIKPDLTTVEAVKTKYHTKTRVVGDSKKLGKIGDAVREGFYAAASL